MKTLAIQQHAHQGSILKVRIRIRVSLFGTALLSLSLLAQTSERDLSELSLDELLETKVQTVTAAAKRTQSVSDAPSAVSVITNDEIRKSGYQNLGEVLANTRGFYTSSDRNYTYLGVRGFGRPGDYNSRVLVLVNGQRMNDNVTGGALIGNDFLVDPDLIDRVEIVRGPGSSLYGSNAFFAVVNVITRNGKDFNGAEAAFTTGSLDTYMGRFSYGTVIRKEIDFLISGTVMERGGNSSLYYPEYDDPSTSNGVTQNTDGESRRSLLSHVAWKGLTLEGGWVERQKQIPTGSFESLFGDPRNETIDATYYGRLRLEHSFENELKLDANISSTSYTFDGSYIYEDPQLARPYRFVDRIRGQWLTEEIQLNRTWWDRWTITLGMEARQNLSQDQNNYQEDPFVTVLSAPRTSQTWGPFLDTSLNLRTNLTLAAGIRHDRGDFVGNRTSPRASLIYRPIPATTFKFLYGQAFRAPNAYERFYADGLTQKMNPLLSPESIDTYEVVLEQELGSHFRASASGYVYFVDDLIDQELDTDGLLFYRNRERVRGRGLEFEVTGRFEHGLRSRLSYSIQQSKDRDTSMQLSNSPERLVQGSLIVPIYEEKVFSGVNFRYVSGRISASGANVPSYVTVNLTLFSHRFINGLELTASVYNLLDRRIQEPAPLELMQSLVEQDGRTVQMKLTYRF